MAKQKHYKDWLDYSEDDVVDYTKKPNSKYKKQFDDDVDRRKKDIKKKFNMNKRDLYK